MSVSDKIIALNTVLDKISPMMKPIIILYQSARSLNCSQQNKHADELLNEIINNKISIKMPMKLNDGILGIACGIIYLHHYHYVKGDIDNSLSEIDRYILKKLDNYVEGSGLPWKDWLYYLRLRIQCDRNIDRKIYELRIHHGIILLLDCLFKEFQNGYILSNQEIEEIEILHMMQIYPLRTKDLLRDYDRVCFIIPVRIDSKERERNLDFVLEQLSQMKNVEIQIIEGDCHPKYVLKHNYSNVYYQFKEDVDPIFYRTRYLNDIMRQVQASIVGIWDTDVYVDSSQIQEAIRVIKRKQAVFCLPYNSQVIMLSSESTNLFIKEMTKTSLIYDYSVIHGCGGAFFVNRSIYLQTGGENEHFYGWG